MVSLFHSIIITLQFLSIYTLTQTLSLCLFPLTFSLLFSLVLELINSETTLSDFRDKKERKKRVFRSLFSSFTSLFSFFQWQFSLKNFNSISPESTHLTQLIEALPSFFSHSKTWVSFGFEFTMAETAETKAVPEAEKKKEQSLPFYQLFTFADKYDYLLMISGSLGAIIHGSSMPVFFLLFGEMVNGFGKNQSDLTKMTHEVAKVHFSPFFIKKYIKNQISFFLCFIFTNFFNVFRSKIC